MNFDVCFGIVNVFIGLLGCGKMIFLWVINCMYDLIFGVCVIGSILFDG